MADLSRTPFDPFDRSRLPGDFSRDGRVRLLGEAAEALLAGRMPDREALLFLAGGLHSWLEEGGSLTRDFWRVTSPPGSRHTPSHLWRQHSSSRGATDDDDELSMGPSNGEPHEPDSP